jgi:universal stress protein E
MKLERITVAIKPWQRGLPLAANHARQLAQSVDARIELVSSVFDAAVAAGSDRGDAAARVIQDRTTMAARVELERLAASLRDWGAQVTTRVVWGVPPYEAILDAAESWNADLLVVGVHERDTLHARLTDTDWQLMRRVRCPLLLVKSGTFNGYRTILAAVDPLHAHDEPDGLDRAVLDAGRCFAQAFGSELRAVYAWPGAGAFELASAVQVEPGVYYGAENVEAVHRRAVNELAAEFGIAPDEVDLVEGRVPDVIVDTAAKRNAELVVVGTGQRRGLAAATLGNTAEMVAGEIGCDVLVVPPGTEARAAARPQSKIG